MLTGGLSFGLGLVKLTKYPWWFDERVTARVSSLSVSGIWHAARRTEQPHFVYYLLMKGWFRVIGGTSNHWLARFPSVVFMALAVVVLTVLGTRLFGNLGGLVAGLTLATNFHLLHWEQFARSLTLTLFLIVLSTYAFVRALESASPSRWTWVWAVAIVAGAWVNLFAVCVLLGHAAAYVVYRRSTPRPSPMVRRELLVGAGALLVILPNVILVATANNGQLDWIPDVTVRRIVFQTWAWAGRNPFALIAAAVSLAILIVASRQANGKNSTARVGGRTIAPWILALLAGWLISPFVVTLALSIVQNAFDSHYLYPATPALALLVGAAIALLPRRLSTPLLTLVVIVAGLQVARYYGTAPYGSFRSLF